MEQRLENSTLIALRELRGYEKERELAERRKQEEAARLARERKEQERQAEAAARERALEKQLRMDLQRAEAEIRLLRQEADRRMREATQALQALQALTSVPKVPSLPAPAHPARRGSWLAASGCTALLASVLVLVIGFRRAPLMPTEDSRRNASCMEAVAPAASPKTAVSAPATEVATAQSTVSGPIESGRQRPPTPHPLRPGIPHTIRKPNPPKPTCDGTDPLCGLNINSIAPR
jgi:hypothetical protein